MAQTAFNRAAVRLKRANYWVTAKLALSVLAVLRRLPMQRTLATMDRAARVVGPLTGRHRVAMENLRRAFPEKPEAELRQIASDMWGNMARLAAEYVFLDRLLAGGIGSEPDRGVTIEGVDRFFRIRQEERPHILFSAHIGNFEMLMAAVSLYDLDVSALFRRPNNPYIAEEIAKVRGNAMGTLLESRPGVSLTLARVLAEGGNIGVLVDQKFRGGVRTTFFGRACETSPLLPKLARQYDCDVYPVRCVRLTGRTLRHQAGGEAGPAA